MIYKGCIVVQGKPDVESYPKIKEGFSQYQLIHSCWVGDDISFLDKGDIIIQNEIPIDRGPQNFYMQKRSTIGGIKMAQQMGWERVLKWRSDMWCVDGEKLFDKFDNTKLNLYYWVDNLDGYIMDLFMEGECSDIITLFETDIPRYRYNYPEFGITLQFFKNGLNEKGIFMGRKLDKECDIYWPKNNIWFTQHKQNNWYMEKLPDNWKEWIPMRRGNPIDIMKEYN